METPKTLEDLTSHQLTCNLTGGPFKRKMVFQAPCQLPCEKGGKVSPGDLGQVATALNETEELVRLLELEADQKKRLHVGR